MRELDGVPRHAAALRPEDVGDGQLHVGVGDAPVRAAAPVARGRVVPRELRRAGRREDEVRPRGRVEDAPRVLVGVPARPGRRVGRRAALAARERDDDEAARAQHPPRAREELHEELAVVVDAGPPALDDDVGKVEHHGAEGRRRDPVDLDRRLAEVHALEARRVDALAHHRPEAAELGGARRGGGGGGLGFVRRRAEPAPGALAPRRGRLGQAQRELEALVAHDQHARHRRQQGDVVDGLGHAVSVVPHHQECCWQGVRALAACCFRSAFSPYHRAAH